jgi:hypothetical protein
MLAVYRSLPVVPRTLTADAALLDSLYEAGKCGLEGDALALAAGMLPSELPSVMARPWQTPSGLPSVSEFH